MVTDLAGIQVGGGALQGRQVRLKGWKGKEKTSVPSVKCVITGYEERLEQPLQEGWSSGIEMPAQAWCSGPFRSCWVEIKQNRIRKGVAAKVLAGTEIFIGGGNRSGVQKEEGLQEC